MKKLIHISICLLLSISSFAQNYPIKKINGIDHYVYTVEASEGIYRVSKKFNVSQSDIYKANPGLDEGLKAGQTLYIPVTQQNKGREISTSNANTKVVEHRVVAKQTLYSISKMYGVEQNDIIRINPEIQNGVIKVGQIIKIPVSNITKGQGQEDVMKQINETPEPATTQTPQKQSPKVEKKKYVTYEVKSRRETLMSISKQFGVSINEIIEANPYAQNGIKKGDILQIPIDEKNLPKSSAGDLMHVVQPKETIYGICREYEISQEELLRLNPRLTNGLRTGDTILIARQQLITEPTDKAAPNTSNRESFYATNHTTKSYKVAYLLPFSIGEGEKNVNIDRFVEFYRGSLIAMENLKESGISFEVYAFDTQIGTSKIEELVNNKRLKDIDIIIGPAYPEQITAVATYAKKNNIIQVVPFTSHVNIADKYAKQYQYNPSVNDLDRVFADNMAGDYKNDNIFFVTFSNSKKSNYQLPLLLEKTLKSKSIRYIRLNANSLTAEQIALLKRNKRNLVVAEDCTEEEFTAFANSLNYDLKNITFLTDYNIFSYIQNNPVLKSKNFVTHSLFNANPTDSYVSRYNNYFVSRTATTLPNYDLLGYDITLYFGKALQPDRQLAFPNNIVLQQSTFNFTKHNSGFLNVGYFVYRLRNNSLNIEKM